MKKDGQRPGNTKAINKHKNIRSFKMNKGTYMKKQSGCKKDALKQKGKEQQISPNEQDYRKLAGTIKDIASPLQHICKSC
ncbi:hypothetical protein [Treponema phagedenis]|uniref:hypothetical protein n=1 Tax=Treponema phagedenis TaxID=162 RepID=UPI0001F6423C|nr:hypothetical protein [Treponema phagedenis]EFW39264.1 hypothetical protein HMPREF9554_00224 [Treponema phagedenis F0421]TYT79746.1 hypothetical protein FS559_12065 [Treponema phagedenis]